MIATITDATTYFNARLYADRWTNASKEIANADGATKQTVALTWANTIIESCVVEWFSGAFTDEDETTFVDDIKGAICEQALYLLSIDPTEYPELLTLGAKITNGTTLDKDYVAPLISPTARKTLQKYAVLTSENALNGTARATSLGY